MTIYNETMSGGVKGGGAAPEGLVFRPYIKPTGATAGGAALGGTVTEIPVASGGVLAGGSISSTGNFSYTPMIPAGVRIAGAAMMRYDYQPDGGPVVASGSATSRPWLDFDQPVYWQTRSSFTVDLTVNWNTGELPLRWWRVQGCCRFPNPNPVGGTGSGGTNGQPAGCDVMSLQTDDPSCGGLSSGRVQSVQNILARTASDVCQQLTASGNTWDICSLKVYSIPVSGGTTAGQTCNVLTEVPFKQIPECMPLALHTRAAVKAKMSIGVIDAIKESTGAGTVYTYGSAVVSSPQNIGMPTWEYTGSGTILTSGSAATTSSWKSTLGVNMKMGVAVKGMEVVFGTIVNTPPLATPPATIGTNCGECTNMPIVMYLHHNLSDGGVLVNFLQRNGLSFPSPLIMHYSRRLGSWLANFHLSGISDDNLNSQETWRFSFEWTCTSLIDGQDFGSSSWKFSMLAVRHNVTTGHDFDTRFMLVFPPSLCNGMQNLGFDFSFTLNTSKMFASVDPDFGFVPDLLVLVDNIGLFKSQVWVDDPNLIIRLSKTSDEAPTPREDITPILPQPVTVAG